MDPPAKTQPQSNDSDSEDDYMKMTFTDDPSTLASSARPSQPETSLQRRQRERREAEARSHVKSKAELAAEVEARREAAHATSLLTLASSSKPKSKGLAMMAKMGFTGGALGTAAKEGGRDDRVVEPIRIAVKDGREGIGLESDRKRKLREAAEAAGEVTKRARVDEGEYRERMRREREHARLERQVCAAQKVAESMDDERTEGDAADEGREEREEREAKRREAKKGRAISSRPLKSLPVMYRGLVKAREEGERDRRMRHDLEQSLSRLPTYEDGDEDEDDKRALDKTQTQSTTYVTADDLDDEDVELDEFNTLPMAERLQRLVEYLRAEHRYCFWCKFVYPDAEMDGCPGLTEEDHD
ncbi:G-patch domain-containing protein [Lasiosphaeria hispida]|uniref:G-patch domain-containing protein n=1 Tax=Lasiosphaeria hispida TaxID=260671 RepID=A0AAJ0HUL2_9PEZI|nr:G-patch domain-containing protein [Lasiosphaeria hispida]